MAPTSAQFDGFEEVALPDVEEEEEPPKGPTASKSKRRKEAGAPTHEKVRGSLVVSSFHESGLEPLPKCLSALGRRQARLRGCCRRQSPWGQSAAAGESEGPVPGLLAQLFLLPVGLHVCLCVHVKEQNQDSQLNDSHSRHSALLPSITHLGSFFLGYPSADARSNLCRQRSPLQFTDEDAGEQRGHGRVSLFLRARLGWDPT